VGRAPRPRRRAQLSVERGAADSWRPGVARLPGEALPPTSFDFVVFTLDPRDATLTGFGLLAVGARAPRP
jgi:hypothetical protein